MSPHAVGCSCPCHAPQWNDRDDCWIESFQIAPWILTSHHRVREGDMVWKEITFPPTPVTVYIAILSSEFHILNAEIKTRIWLARFTVVIVGFLITSEEVYVGELTLAVIYQSIARGVGGEATIRNCVLNMRIFFLNNRLGITAVDL